jgi:hypothetical protein
MRLLVVLWLLVLCSGLRGQSSLDSLVRQPYTEIPLGAIKPKGWLLHQLEIMRDGSTGHLDEIHDKIKNDNGWLGGRGDGWEETPYWLDGAVPLAYLLDDKQLKEKVLRYVHWTLDHQRPSGYFGPITKDEREKNIAITPETCASGEDWWPKMVMLKVLQQYFEASHDPRVIPFMTNYFRYQLAAIKNCPLGKWTEWATSRGAENMMMIQWLYSKTKYKFLLDLASEIEKQSFPWSTWLGNRDWVMHAAANQTSENWMTRHAVNIGMALKAPVMSYQRSKDSTYLRAIDAGWSDLMLLHGLPMGIFSGDEDLHGNDPTQGVELCAIVETMFSLEKIIAITGDMRYMDALERITFNALPTQTTDTYNEKQYFQVANQVEVSRGVFDFSLPFDRGMNNVFGLRSGYTCCTANMHQGWTKFASHLWYSMKGNGIAALAYGPNTLTTEVGAEGTPVVINEITNYPFEDKIVFEIAIQKATVFPVTFRIPSWCKSASIEVNGEVIKPGTGRTVTLNRTWKNKDRILLRLPMEVTTSSWAKNSRAVERGPLVYALKLGERWEKASEEKEGDYFSVYPTETWNYGLVEDIIKNPGKFSVTLKPMPEKFIWNQQNAPIEIRAAGKKIPAWKVVNGVAHQPVTDRNGVYKGEVEPEVYDIQLIPYGCTKVRVVAFPVVK